MSPTYTLVADLLNEIRIPEKGILSHTLYNDDAIRIVLFGFAAGQELTAHTAPMPATIQFLEGEAEVTLGPDKREVAAGALIQMQPQLTHGIMAKTPVLMLLYLHKAARQA
ncbi:MAG TPA: cupin domain-containing protein [Bryobacteraceae bacterium]|nr:cupin domain-containing protein [Bryobacteraceae bacterium]